MLNFPRPPNKTLLSFFSLASTILIPTKQVTGSLKVTNKAYSGELVDKNSDAYSGMREHIFEAVSA